VESDNSDVSFLVRMGITALVIGSALSTAATGRVTLPLVLSGFVCWSFVPVLQLATGWWMLRGGPGAGRATLDGYFATYRPWLLWLLAMAAVALMPSAAGMTLYLATTAVIPAALTIRALTRFSRDELGDSPRAARRRVAAHQVVTFILALIYADLSVALWPRVVEVFGP
jgi:hypothetical protein